jgi:hypothetical protein
MKNFPATIRFLGVRSIFPEAAAAEAFEHQTDYSHIPLACGGADDASNLQWWTIA